MGASTNNRKKKRVDNPMPMRAVPNQKETTQKVYRTATVLFVEQTRGGSLAKEIKGVMGRITPMLGARMKVVERGGRNYREYYPTKIHGKVPNVEDQTATHVTRPVSMSRIVKLPTLCTNQPAHFATQGANLPLMTCRTGGSSPAYTWGRLPGA